MNASDFQPLMLDLMVVFSALGVLVMDISMPAGRKRGLGQFTALMLGGILALSFIVDTQGSAFSGAYLGGTWPLFFKRLFLGIGALVALGGIDHVDRRYPNRQGEFWLLMLSSILGMMLIPGAQNLILLLVAFELMGMPLAILAAYAKTDDVKKGGPGKSGPEGALKLFIISSASTAITVLGFSLLFGAAGSLDIAALAKAPMTPLLQLGLFATLAGMAFKIGAVPFHMWVPDTYQAAPTPFVAFLSVAPKAAGFAALALILVQAFGGAQASWMPLLLILIVLTLVVGNVLAVPQNDVKRLLGYSGIAQIGYMMMGLATGTNYGLALLLFYLVGYAVTNIGTFLVVEAVTGDSDDADISRFNGLWQRSPALAMAMLVFLLSLAGIPFMVGFWAKLYIFMAAYQAGLGWLVFTGAALSILALYYYLRVATAIYMRPATDDMDPIRMSTGLKAAIILCFIAVVGIGAYPGPFVEAALAVF